MIKPIPKIPPLRSLALRNLAKKYDVCQNDDCQRYAPMEIVGCHAPSSLSFGGGTGHKGDDIVAYLCSNCHHAVDGRDSGLDYEVRLFIWALAVRRSMVTAFRNGWIGVKKGAL